MPVSMIRYHMNPDAVIMCSDDDMLPAGTARIMRGEAGQYLIRTAVPAWIDGEHGEEYQLRSCYRTSFALALEYGCETVEVPILTGSACPKDQAMQIAVEEADRFSKEYGLSVFLVAGSCESCISGTKLFKDVQAYIHENYEEPFFPEEELTAPEGPLFSGSFAYGDIEWDDSGIVSAANASFKSELNELLRATDEGFTEALFRLIDERGMTDAQCYKKANVDRKLFSKIRSSTGYRPSKPTVCAFAMALELPLAEAKDLIGKAGYSLTHSNQFDIIVEYFLKKQYYDIMQINEVLFEHDLPLLGSNVA